MAFASVGSINTNGSNNNSASTSLRITASDYNWASGDFLVVVVGLDNLGTSDAETSQVTAVEVRNSSDVTVDTFVKAVEYTNGSPGANAGATVSIWYLTATVGRPSLGDIAVTLSGSTTNKTAVGRVFSRDTSKTVQIQAGTKATGEAKSITSGAITNAVEALLIRGLAIEDNENAIDTNTANWTAWSDSSAFTTGGGAAANMACGAEHRIMTGAGAGVTSNPGGTSSGDMASAIIAFEEVSAGARTLTCATASYSISGTASALERSRIMPAASASYSISGTAATLSKGRPLAAGSGSYAVTGTAAAFKRTYVMAANTASYVISGTAAILAQGYKLVADTVAYAVSGTAAALVRGKAMAAEAGSYAVSGAAVVFLRGRVLAAASGSYAVSGASAALKWARSLAAAAGSYAVTGTAAALARSRILVASAGSYAISGASAVLVRGRTLVAAVGAYALAGTDAAFIIVRFWVPTTPTSGSWSDTADGSGTWTPIPPTTGNWS